MIFLHDDRSSCDRSDAAIVRSNGRHIYLAASLLIASQDGAVYFMGDATTRTHTKDARRKRELQPTAKPLLPGAKCGG